MKEPNYNNFLIDVPKKIVCRNVECERILKKGSPYSTDRADNLKKHEALCFARNDKIHETKTKGTLNYFSNQTLFCFVNTLKNHTTFNQYSN